MLNLQKNEKLQNAIWTEVQCHALTYTYYGQRNDHEIIEFYEANSNRIISLMEDVGWLCKKYSLNFDKLFAIAESLYEESTPEHANWTPIHRLNNDGHLIGDDSELLESLDKKYLFIVYPEVVFKLKNISSKHYSNYLEIIEIWIFLTISYLIQIHTDINKRNSDELASIILNRFSVKKITRSALEKASLSHIHPKAVGAYIYEYYGQIYKDDLQLVRKTIKINGNPSVSSLKIIS